MPIEYIIHLTVLFEIYLVLSLGLLLLLGIGGVFTLAQVSLFGIGAYTTAILSVDYGFSTLPTVILSIGFTVIAAFILGLISLRLRSDYFAIGSLAFALVVHSLLVNWKSVTKGVLGIPGIQRPSVFGLSLDDNVHFLIWMTIITSLSSILIWTVLRSRLGRALRAQSEFPEGLSSIGLDPVRGRLYAFCISAVVAGVAGSSFAYYLSFIDPSSFAISEMVTVLAIVVLGGLKRTSGIVASVLLFVLLPELLRFVSIPDSMLGAIRQGLYGILLFIIVYYKRTTLFPPQRSL